ncbi:MULTISPECIES: DUF4349 domain-containing protein [Microbacterium]|uniref:DUF4349 domain-containing protein n=1 Tax=Microbacterium TaxID=33882 RepID=UPI0021A5DB17|nr:MULTISPECIES: DUF4349 domain-containing protein [Microbacterium]MCT1363438.1 DUF4349 domain-containing protein [Microbacterium sp. p3-SID131]MCT1377162.1 DUF4349 domain-containing protein [Microbacterium sp. p3-SID337]MCZ0708807.1 DUF4349 domain-containing protein [Microbacterium paraoxydans]
MNHQTPQESLPPLSDATVARIEEAVFTEIRSERRPLSPRTERARNRRRRLLTAGGIAAAFVVGVLVTPPILGAVGGGGSSVSTADGTAGWSTDEAGSAVPDRAVEGATLPGTVGSDAAASAEDARDIVATAQASVQVRDIADAASAIGDLAVEHGGYVESTEVGRAVSSDAPAEPAPADSGYGWITVRIPADDLTTVIAALGDTGEVLSSSVTKQDVTATAIDLRARVESTRASVQRLTELMGQSGTVADLIEAEVALTDRQAQLESYEQQLAALEDQVTLSSLTVELSRSGTAASADPAGFGDGLLAGWNGLVVSLNALVIAVGFLLPWLAVAAVVVLIVWLLRRGRRKRRAPAAPPVRED